MCLASPKPASRRFTPPIMMRVDLANPRIPKAVPSDTLACASIGAAVNLDHQDFGAMAAFRRHPIDGS
jgi:hypothetical protein